MTLDEYKREVRDILKSSNAKSVLDIMCFPEAEISRAGEESDDSVVTVKFVVRNQALKDVTANALQDLTTHQYMELLNYSSQKLSDLDIH